MFACSLGWGRGGGYMVYNWYGNTPSCAYSNFKDPSKMRIRMSDLDFQIADISNIFFYETCSYPIDLFEVQGTSCRENCQG